MTCLIMWKGDGREEKDYSDIGLCSCNDGCSTPDCIRGWRDTGR